MNKLLLIPTVAILLMVGLKGHAEDRHLQVGQPEQAELTATTGYRAPVRGLSELEKANNALARVMGRTLPHPEQHIIVIDSKHYVPVMIDGTAR